jgi:hypothetical protein
MRLRAERRATRPARRWHAPLLAVAAAGFWVGVDALCLRWYGAPPTLSDVWWLVPLPALLAGALVAAGAGGATIARRIRWSVATGIVAGAVYGAVHVLWPLVSDGELATGWPLVRHAVSAVAWRAFLFAIFATLGALAWETLAPEAE